MAGERYVSENTNIYSNDKWLHNIEGLSDYEISDHKTIRSSKECDKQQDMQGKSHGISLQ